jgi:hypothetical protein
MDTSKVERIDFPENISDDDIAQFRNMDQGGLQEFMNGDSNRHQEGGRHDLNPRGLSSEDFATQQQNVVEQQQWNDLSQSENMFAPQQNSQSEAADWKKLYGREANEKGELRRHLNEAITRIQQLEQQQQFATQLATMPPPPQFFGVQPQQQQQQPQYNGGYAQAQPNPFVNLPSIIGKGDDEMLLASDVDKAIKEKVAPYLEAVAWKAQQAEAQALAVHQRLFESQKLSMGLTPQVEMQVLASKPWLRNVQDPSSYLGAMQAEVNALKAVQQAQAQAEAQQHFAPPTPQQPNVAQQALRRRTFIERGGSAQPEQNSRSAEQMWQAEWAKSLAMPYGSPERSVRQKQLLEMRGMNQVSGYRDPSILSR